MTINFKNARNPIVVGKGSGASIKGPRTIGGWITTFGPPCDSYGDIMDEHSLDRHLREVGNRLPGLSGHDVNQMIGWHELKKVPGKGVWTDFTFLDGITRADEDLVRVKSGGMAFSIGYMTQREEVRGGYRWLMDIDLLETSVVFLPANPRAVIEQRMDVESEAAFRSLLQNTRRITQDVIEMRRASMTPAERALDRMRECIDKLKLAS